MSTFKPFDDGTVALAVTSASASIDFTALHNGSTARLANVGGELVYIKFGGSDVTADENDIPMLGNTVEVFALPNGVTHCAAASDSSPGSNTLYITPGDGD